MRAMVLGCFVVALAGCGGSGGTSSSEPPPPTETVSAAVRGAEPVSGTASAVNVGETATWRGDTFTVSDVETSDTAPVADILGEQPVSENGVWLSFTITPVEDDSGIWSSEFVENLQINGGDGVLYEDSHNNGSEQQFNGEGDFVVWTDIPEAAASGAVLLVNDGVHTVDPDPGNPYADPIPDPAYATRVDLAP